MLSIYWNTVTVWPENHVQFQSKYFFAGNKFVLDEVKSPSHAVSREEKDRHFEFVGIARKDRKSRCRAIGGKEVGREVRTRPCIPGARL
jgi:hypothetical protein